MGTQSFPESHGSLGFFSYIILMISHGIQYCNVKYGKTHVSHTNDAPKKIYSKALGRGNSSLPDDWFLFNAIQYSKTTLPQ